MIVMEKKVVESTKGLSGMLKAFKSMMQGLGLGPTTKIVFVGNPGTCTPFIELFAYTVRDLVKGMAFVPDGIVEDARAIWLVNGVGMQIGGAADPQGADYVVLLGGLSMPGSKVSPEQADKLIGRLMKPGGKVIGVCFMDMFCKAGWEDKPRFDLVMNADINPVNISRFE
ncbi:MAG TPA: DUF2124 domain-containing protein [Methanocella sp.]|nr:DUF2124 domain-containing protein [Methanocella sp.]